MPPAAAPAAAKGQDQERPGPAPSGRRFAGVITLAAVSERSEVCALIPLNGCCTSREMFRFWLKLARLASACCPFRAEAEGSGGDRWRKLCSNSASLLRRVGRASNSVPPQT